ncbi:uncharacterized protein LOC105701760 [Orussus abietinus]|uniref:uncharacterized protein LOC105701760 n=1 Tax=Orussus abietinus TaxID=222816 RepID=UPI000625DF4E|nr:uncharacterized protein LOC105701760 [Orussus abietinus]
MTAVILLLSCGGGELKVILVLINRKTIGRLLKAIEELANDTESEEFAILSSWAVIGRRLTLCFVSFGVMLAFHWAFLPVFLHFTGLKIAEMTPYPLSINVSSIDALKFEMICIAQTVSAFGCVFSAVGVDSIRVTLIFEICGQLDLICFWLKQTQSDDLVSSRDIIYKCARRHRFMLICSKKLEESTTYATLVQLLTIMYMIAISGANFFLVIKKLSTFLILVPDTFVRF